MPRGIKRRKYTKRDHRVSHWGHVLKYLLDHGQVDLAKTLMTMAKEDCPSCTFECETTVTLRLQPTGITA